MNNTLLAFGKDLSFLRRFVDLCIGSRFGVRGGKGWGMGSGTPSHRDLVVSEEVSDMNA
jgi:hypothetical protein